MGIIGGCLLLKWPVTRILQTERGSNDQYLVQAIFLFCRQDHASNFGVNREFRQTPTNRGQLPVVIDGTQFRQ